MQASDALQTKSFDEWSDVGDSVAVYVLQQCEKWKIIDESVDTDKILERHFCQIYLDC